MRVMDTIRSGFLWLISPSLPAYLLRGASSVALFLGGLALLDSLPLLGIAMAFGSLIPLGGCPACWLGGTIGAACAYRPPQSRKQP
jgi:hypothetical protein